MVEETLEEDALWAVFEPNCAPVCQILDLWGKQLHQCDHRIVKVSISPSVSVKAKRPE